MIEMVTFTAYRSDSGAIVCVVTCPTVDADANTPAGCARIAGAWDGRVYWVDDGAAVLRGVMAPVVAGRTVSNLPIPCTTTIEGVEYLITDGVLELSATLPGPYVVLFEAVPFLPCEVTIP